MQPGCCKELEEKWEMRNEKWEMGNEMGIWVERGGADVAAVV
jgi:hypothetical protein